MFEAAGFPLTGAEVAGVCALVGVDCGDGLVDHAALLARLATVTQDAPQVRARLTPCDCT